MVIANSEVSVIIVNHNDGLHLLCCLDSIRDYAQGTEVILVDNASQGGLIRQVADRYPQVTIIKNSENHGFSRAVNQGVKASKNKYILLLHSDTVLTTTTLETFVKSLKQSRDQAILGPKILNVDGTVQSSASTFKGSLIRKYFFQNKLEWLSGAALFMARETFDRLGGFDERFFMYYEDIDFCRRAQKAQIATVLESNILIYHAEGRMRQSLEGKIKRVVYFHQSMWFFFQKHIQTTPFLTRLAAMAIFVRATLYAGLALLGEIVNLPIYFQKVLNIWMFKYLLNNKFKPYDLSEAPRRVLLLRTDHLGGVLLTLPAIALLRQRFPNTEFHFMARNEWKDLLTSTGCVDKFIPSARGLLMQYIQLKENQYDWIIQFGLKSTLVNSTLSWLAKIPVRLGYHTHFEGLFYSNTLRYDHRVRSEITAAIRLLKKVGIDSEDRTFMGFEKTQFQPLPNLPKDYVVIHPFTGAGSGLKQWPLGRFLEVASKLTSEGRTIVIVGSRSDKKSLESLHIQSSIQWIDLIGKTTLHELMSVVSHAQLVIANHSGIYQLANAMNKRTILINGPSNLKRWGAPNKNTKVVSVSGLACVGRDCDVCIRGDHACLREISVQQVYDFTQ